jgi:hypothetical protein
MTFADDDGSFLVQMPAKIDCLIPANLRRNLGSRHLLGSRDPRVSFIDQFAFLSRFRHTIYSPDINMPPTRKRRAVSG